MTATDLDHVALALESLDWFLEASHPTGVLVASADLDTRLALAHHLEGLGYGVWTAGSGSDAYEVGIEHPVGIDVLVCDTDLSDVPAPELYRRLKIRHPGLRCCVLTTNAERESAAEAGRLGAVVLDVDSWRDAYGT